MTERELRFESFVDHAARPSGAPAWLLRGRSAMSARARERATDSGTREAQAAAVLLLGSSHRGRRRLFTRRAALGGRDGWAAGTYVCYVSVRVTERLSASRSEACLPAGPEERAHRRERGTWGAAGRMCPSPTGPVAEQAIMPDDETAVPPDEAAPQGTASAA